MSRTMTYVDVPKHCMAKKLAILFFLGEWYGIEWDDHTRGKHDGTNEGVSYFECKYATL